MKTIARLGLGACLAGLLCGQSAVAQVIISYFAPDDPSSQNWTTIQSGTGQTAGALDVNGTPAWQVEDFSTEGLTYYSFTPDAGTVNNALAQGWTLTATVRLPQISDGNAGGSPGLAFVTGDRLFGMHLGTELNGDPLIYLPGSGFFFTDLDTGFHTYQFVFDPNTQSASFSIDGVERVGVYHGLAGTYTPEIWFGASGLTDTGVGQFNSVQMTVVPEPQTYALIAGISLLAFAAVRGFRKPAQAHT